MKHLSFIFLIFISIGVVAQQLDPVIHSVSIQNQSVRVLFDQIEEQTNLTFSYNSRLINKDSTFSYSASNQLLSEVINDLFNHKLETKIIGDYIVLIVNRKLRKKDRKNTESQLYRLNGKISNARNKQLIFQASVYDVYSRKTILTDSLGYFELNLKGGPNQRSISFAKENFKDTLILLDLSKQNEIQLLLIPIGDVLNLRSKRRNEVALKSKSDFIGGIVPKKERVTSQNLQFIYEKRPVQISFLPLLGSNTRSSGIIENNFSLNVLAGYNGGVNGLEIGGLVNVINRNVHGIQVAGIANIVGEKMNGIQVAAIFNKNGGRVSGLQISGISNWLADSLDGFQISGLSNITKGSVNGFQLTGINNFSSGSVKGFQISGITNIALKNTKGVQVTGIYNFTKDKTEGVQVAGIYNQAADTMEGAQVALINYTKLNNGFQIGLINVSDSSNGVAIGLLNIVIHGYHAIELYATDVFYANFVLKLGARHFYTLYNIGIHTYKNNTWGVGFGFGTNIKLKKHFSLSMDLYASYINETPNQELTVNVLSRFDLTIDYQVGKHWLFGLGPSYNFHISNLMNESGSEFNSDIAQNPFYEKVNGNYRSQMWLGAKALVRFLF